MATTSCSTSSSYQAGPPQRLALPRSFDPEPLRGGGFFNVFFFFFFFFFPPPRENHAFKPVLVSMTGPSRLLFGANRANTLQPVTEPLKALG